MHPKPFFNYSSLDLFFAPKSMCFCVRIKVTNKTLPAKCADVFEGVREARGFYFLIFLEQQLGSITTKRKQ